MFTCARDILSLNRVREESLVFSDISSSAVQALRENKKPGITGSKYLHDYVPLYFGTQTPMQYVISHPASTRGREITKPQDELDWNVINCPGDYQGSEGQCYSREWRRKKCSEVLVPNSVPVELFSRSVTFRN